MLLSIHSFTGSQGVIILELAGDAGYFHMVLKTHYALLSNSWNNCREKKNTDHGDGASIW
jgi:hypothetical protein